MGWVVTRADQKGRPRFTARYRDLRGQERSCGTFATEEKAVRAWQRAEDDLHRGRIGDPKRGRQTFRDYVQIEWLPNHVMEETTREGYVYALNRHILPEFGGRSMREILPIDVREWIVDLQQRKVRPPTIRNCKVILDAVLTTALNDQIVYLHAGKGVKTPPVARKPKRIITAEQYQRISDALGDEVMRLLVEVDIESGLRWGELTELRPKDLDLATGILTVARVVVHLNAKERSPDQRYVVKHYPKDKEWRHVGLAPHVVAKIAAHIDASQLGPDDLLFSMPDLSGPRRLTRPAILPNPVILGLTEPNDDGRQYLHGTLTAYQAARCRCQHCRNAVAAYRAERRAAGKDKPRRPRRVETDGHIPNAWFRTRIWKPALAIAEIGFNVTPHGLRHAHASWLLAGGADLQVVKERLGHGSITTTEGYLHTLPNAHEAALSALDVIRGQKTLQAPESAEPDRSTSEKNELDELRSMVNKMNRLLGEMSEPSS